MIFRPFIWCLFLSLALGACRDENTPIKEPVVTQDDNQTYGEDPELGSTNDRTVNNNNNNHNSRSGSEVISDPFAADAPPIIEGDEELMASATPNNENSLPELDNVYGNALTDNHEVGRSQVQIFPKNKEIKKTKKQATKKVAKSKSKKIKGTNKKSAGVWRYVKPMLLNVRTAPSLKAPIARRLLGGAKIRVTTGHPRGFVKLKTGQYVRAKHLSRSPTKRITRAQAERAWRRKPR
jgi:hypothetical protein